MSIECRLYDLFPVTRRLGYSLLDTKKTWWNCPSDYIVVDDDPQFFGKRDFENDSEILLTTRCCREECTRRAYTIGIVHFKNCLFRDQITTGEVWTDFVQRELQGVCDDCNEIINPSDTEDDTDEEGEPWIGPLHPSVEELSLRLAEEGFGRTEIDLRDHHQADYSSDDAE